MSSLAARQDIILDKLKELKEQLVTMKNNSRMCFKPPQNQPKVNSKNNAQQLPKGRCQPKVSVLSDGRQSADDLYNQLSTVGQCA